MDELITKLKLEIMRLAGDPNFIHHKWFIKYHIEIVEKIALELCDLYPEVDHSLILTIIWMHDYGRFFDRENRHQETLDKAPTLLASLGFTDKFSNQVIEYIKIMDNKAVIASSPIEVQIVSSADAASHLMSPFYSIYFYENPNVELEDILESNVRKLHRDWEKKFILPELRKKLEPRHKFLLEQNGAKQE